MRLPRVLLVGAFSVIAVSHVCAQPTSVPSTPALSVSEAYALVPHRQTTYVATQSQLHTEIAQNIERFFRLSDRALVARVMMFRWCQSDGKANYSLEAYRRETAAVQAELGKLVVPAEARPAIKAVREALALHSDYFKLWVEAIHSGKPFADAFRPGRTIPALVKQANEKLLSAYRIMMGAFPNESDMNKQAFYDHLCALDFI